MAGVSVNFTWDGDELELAASRAVARAMVRTANDIVDAARNIVPVVTGQTQRSIHSAPADYDGADDEAQSKTTDLRDTTPVDPDAGDPQELMQAGIAVGSWVPWAGEVEDRTPFLAPAVEQGMAAFEGYVESEMADLGNLGAEGGGSIGP